MCAPNVLLEEHNQPSSSDTSEVILGPEAVRILSKLIDPNTALFFRGKTRVSRSKGPLFSKPLGLDLKVFDLNKFVIRREVTKIR